MKKQTKPLSKRQKEALLKMKDKTWITSYDLGESLTTLGALAIRGFAIHIIQLGSSSSPKTGILWRLTAAGVKKAKELEKASRPIH